MIWKRGSLQAALVQYLKAQGPDANKLLDELAAGIQMAVHKHVSRFGLREHEDLCRDCIAALLIYIDRLKTSGKCSVENLDAFVSRTVENRMKDQFRKANPDRRRIRLDIEHLLNGKLNASGFALWLHPQKGRKIAGFDAWRGRPAKPVRSKLEDPESKRAFVEQWTGGEDPEGMDLADLVCAVLSWHGGPLLLNDLVGVACTLRNVQRVTTLSLDAEAEDGSYVDMLRDPAANVEGMALARIESEEMIKCAWAHMKGLETYRLIAICLKFEPQHLIALAAVAGVSNFAEALGIGIEELADYAARVPLPDDEIAGIVGLDVRQIPGIRDKALKRIVSRSEKSFSSEA